MEPEKFVEEIEDLGEGPLKLGIFCCNCNAQFELNNQAVAIAVMTQTSLLEYIKSVQNSKCPNCEKD